MTNQVPDKFKRAPFPYFGSKSKVAGEVWLAAVTKTPDGIKNG